MPLSSADKKPLACTFRVFVLGGGNKPSSKVLQEGDCCLSECPWDHNTKLYTLGPAPSSPEASSPLLRSKPKASSSVPDKVNHFWNSRVSVLQAPSCQAVSLRRQRWLILQPLWRLISQCASDLTTIQLCLKDKKNPGPLLLYHLNSERTRSLKSIEKVLNNYPSSLRQLNTQQKQILVKPWKWNSMTLIPHWPPSLSSWKTAEQPTLLKKASSSKKGKGWTK